MGVLRVALMGALMLGACAAPTSTIPSTVPLGVGNTAPPFTLPDVEGEQVVFAPGAPTIVSFIAAQPHAENTPDPSRSQVVPLQSMQQQYANRGLRVILVASTIAQINLLNLAYDWELHDTPLLQDTPDRTTARAYGVTRMPTTFLVAQDGRIVGRWDGFVPAAQLGIAIQQALNASAQPTP